MKISSRVACLAGSTLLLASISGHADTIFGSLWPAFGPGYFGNDTSSMFTIYGTVDSYIDHYNAGGTSATRVLSGGAWTSKIGFYGREDLGGGYSAHFRLENGINTNDGTAGQAGIAFNRAAYVGLSSVQYGSIDLGKQFGVGPQLFVDPFFGVAKFSPWAYFASVSDLGRGASGIESRVNNSVMYTSPTYRGFSTQMLYAFKGTQTAGPAVQNRGASVSYQNGMIYGSLQFNQVWCDPSAATCTDPTIRTDIYGAAVVADFGKYGVDATYQLFAPRLRADFVAHEYSLGGLAKFGANLLRASVVYRDTTQASNHALGIQLGEDYFLSKRTALYARASVIKNGPASQMTNDFYGTGPLPPPGGSVTDFGLGIYHNF